MKNCLFLLFIAFSAQGFSQTDSLDIKIGQMLLVGMNGQQVDDLLLQNVVEGKVGGVIFFEKKHYSRKQLYQLKAGYL